MRDTTEIRETAATTADLAPVKEPRGLRLRGRLLVVLFAALSFMGIGIGSSFADTADPTGGIFTTAQGDLTTVIIPAAAALVIVGIVFAVAVKWMSKGMKKG